MTAVIDIVFLLIIFFVLVCQFIEAENFPVTVPDGCNSAESDLNTQSGLTTVTVMRTDVEDIAFAVGSERVTASGYSNLVDKLVRMIDVRMESLPPDRRVVTLRIDKNICFADAQYVLAAVAASSATDIRLATMKDMHADSI